MFTITVWTGPFGSKVADWSASAVNPVLRANEHGSSEFTCRVPMRHDEMMDWLDRPVLWLEVGNAVQLLWSGRIEDVEATADGLYVRAFGAWRALHDAPIVQLWSDTTWERWRVLGYETANGMNATTADSQRDDLYAVIANEDGLTIRPGKGVTYHSQNGVRIGFELPDASTRQIVAFDFTYELMAPTTWFMLISRRDSTWASLSTITSQTSAGALIGPTGYTSTFAGCDRLVIEFRYNSATPVAFAPVETTLAGAVTVTGAQTVNVSSVAGMVNGMRLRVGQNSETITLTSFAVGPPATITATFARTHAVGVAVEADVYLRITSPHVRTVTGNVTAGQIASDFVATFGTATGTLSTSTALVADPGMTLTNEVYEDVLPADVLTRLAELGDGGQQYEVGVDYRHLYLRIRNSQARTWYVDAAEPRLRSTIETLVNSAYSTYRPLTGGRTRRTATVTDAASVARFGLTRRAAVSSRGTDAAAAEDRRDITLTDFADPPPQVAMSFDRVYDSSGARWELVDVRPGDLIVARNTDVPAQRVAATELALSEGRLAVTWAQPVPSLATMDLRSEETGY